MLITRRSWVRSPHGPAGDSSFVSISTTPTPDSRPAAQPPNSQQPRERALRQHFPTARRKQATHRTRHAPRRPSTTFDSSVGRAVDCRGYGQVSIGRWFKSGSKDSFSSLASFSSTRASPPHVRGGKKEEGKETRKRFRYRESNPGHLGESQVS